jgi:hypothetical protein
VHHRCIRQGNRPAGNSSVIERLDCKQPQRLASRITSSMDLAKPLPFEENHVDGSSEVIVALRFALSRQSRSLQAQCIDGGEKLGDVEFEKNGTSRNSKHIATVL